MIPFWLALVLLLSTPKITDKGRGWWVLLVLFAWAMPAC